MHLYQVVVMFLFVGTAFCSRYLVLLAVMRLTLAALRNHLMSAHTFAFGRLVLAPSMALVCGIASALLPLYSISFLNVLSGCCSTDSRVSGRRGCLAEELRHAICTSADYLCLRGRWLDGPGGEVLLWPRPAFYGSAPGPS